MGGGLQHCTCSGDQNHPQEKKCKEAEWLSEETLQIAEKRREVKGKGEKENISNECRVPENNKER